jgi:hypothetical protein
MSDLVQGLNALDKARPGYTLARKMYEGTAKEVAANERIAELVRKSAEKYRANFARKPVRARLNRMKINAYQLASSDTQESGPARVLADAVVKANEFDVEIPRWIELTCSLGDAYLLVWPSADSDAVGETGRVFAGVDVFVRSPESMRAIYDQENARKIKYVIDTWDEGYDKDCRLRVNLYYPDRIERFVSADAIQKESGKAWDDIMFERFDDTDTETGDGDGPVITNPWGVLPIFHGRTARPYGRPVHFDAFGPQNAITKIMATHLSGIDWSGWPWRYALSKANTTGVGLADWDEDTREAPGRPVKTAPGVSARRTDKLNNEPGTMNKLSNVDAVGQLEGAPPATFLEPLMSYIRVLGEVTDTPMNVTDPTGQVESGQSRRARIDDLLSAVEDLKVQLTGPLTGACEFALTVLGLAEQDVTVDWAPSAKVDDLEGWQAVSAQQAAGVPERTTLLEAGYSPDEVAGFMDSLDGKLSTLERIANVGVLLGQANQLLGLPAEQAAALFGAFIMDVTSAGAGTD